jgi:hypothetical protein
MSISPSNSPERSAVQEGNKPPPPPLPPGDSLESGHPDMDCRNDKQQRATSRYVLQPRVVVNTCVTLLYQILAFSVDYMYS